MNERSNPQEMQAADAVVDLARILAKTEEAQAELGLVQNKLEAAQERLQNSQAARIVEANEQLVLATLNAQKAAEVNKRALQEALEAAELDPLTELPNRAKLRARLALAIADAGPRKGRVALLLLGLIDFKQVNDSVGQAVGDAVLKHAAMCLTNSLPPECMVSRHGSDEFLILIPDVTEAEVAAERMIAALGTPARFGDHVLRLTANVGISIFPDDGEQVDSLIDRAVAAMYRAKWRGLSSFSYTGEAAGSTRSLELRTLESLRQPSSAHALVLGDYARHQAMLEEANSQLVVAAIDAQELVAAAERARRHQGDFIGVLAHELRNPLSALRNAAFLLGKIPNGEPLMAKIEDIIERQLASISRLIEDLLDVSRVSTGKLNIVRQQLEIIGLIDEVIGTCRPAIDTRLQKLEVRLPLHMVEMSGDRLRLTQVIANLLDNASKYTPEGGVVRIEALAEKGYLILTVSDTGIGITAETLPHVFEPFVQDAHAMVFDNRGLGIGLTVVRELVEAHGGEISASSDGKMLGSQFTVRLPLVAPPNNPLGTGTI
ncbi:MAG: diguanylate cyclase [Polaromonas sp.]|nr:diguanylate cyclase [Polaromonas sp.]